MARGGFRGGFWGVKKGHRVEKGPEMQQGFLRVPEKGGGKKINAQTRGGQGAGRSPRGGRRTGW